MRPILLLLALCFTLPALCQSKPAVSPSRPAGDSSKPAVEKWGKQLVAYDRRIAALKNAGQVMQDSLVAQESQWERLSRRRDSFIIAAHYHPDSIRLDSIQRGISDIWAHKDSTQHRFDSLLIVIDSTMGVRARLQSRIDSVHHPAP